MKRIFEFLVWDNCNNHCKFCFLKKESDYSSFLKEDKKCDALNAVIDYLNSTEYIKGSHVLLCGGEIFDTPLDSSAVEATYGLINVIGTKMVSDEIDKLYINTNLIYDTSILLDNVLSRLNSFDILHRVHFTTSYDLVGRYKTDADRQLFISNLHKIKKQYPQLDIVANMVLTRPVCELIQLGDISIAALQNELGVLVNIIPYIIFTERLAPTKKQVMNTIKLVDEENPGYMKAYVERFSTNNPRILLKYCGGALKELTTDNLPCGHSENFKRYTAEGSCFICDLLNLYREVCDGQVS